MATLHCFVSGRVQGVWFRASTQREAERIAVTGYVRNLSDGRVEVVAVGSDKQLARLKRWLRQGPPHAEVSDLECRQGDAVEPMGSGFSIR